MTDIVTREEREELRRRLDGTYRLYGYALEFRMPMVLRLFDTIDALEAENERLRKPRCIGCGRTEDELHADDCSHINGTPPLTYEQGIRDVLSIRCVEHFDVPQYNRNEINGGECAACAVEEATNGPDYEPLHDIDGRVVNAPPWSTAPAQPEGGK